MNFIERRSPYMTLSILLIVIVVGLHSCRISRAVATIDTLEKKIDSLSANTVTARQIDSIVINGAYMQIVAERDLDEKQISLTQIKENWKKITK